jgi:hypothetical protein
VLVVRALWSCQWCACESVTPASGHFVVGYSAPIKACAHPRASLVPCSWGMGAVYNKHSQAAAGWGQLRQVDKWLKTGSRWHGPRRLPATRLTWHTHNLSKLSASLQIQRTANGCHLPPATCHLARLFALLVFILLPPDHALCRPHPSAVRWI